MPYLMLGLAILFMVMNGLIGRPVNATDFAAPTLTAWQRSHEGHLTIAWEETTRVQQKRTGDRLILRFAKPLVKDAVPALRNLSNFVDFDRTAIDGADLSLALKPGVETKVSVREKRIVTVDFFRDPLSLPSSNIEISTIDDGIRLTLDWPGATEVDVLKSRNEVDLAIQPAWDLDSAKLGALRDTLEPWINGVRSKKDQERTTLALSLQPQIASSIRSEGSTRTIIDLTRDASVLPAPTAPPASTVFIPKRKPPISKLAEAEASIAQPPIPQRRPNPRSATPSMSIATPKTAADTDKAATTTADTGIDVPDALIIRWDKPVAAAIFRRADHLWAVFDETDAGLLSGSPQVPSAFGPGYLVPADGGTALRFSIKAPFADISVSQTAEGHWRIDPLSPSEMPRPLSVQRAADSKGLRVTPVSEGQVVSIVDPTVGDRIDVLPQREPGTAQPTKRRFVDLEFLPTAQGLAWRPLNDHLFADVDEEGLVLSSPNGLSLSAMATEVAPSEAPVIIEAASKKKGDSANRKELTERPAFKPKEMDEDRSTNRAHLESYFDLAGSSVDRSLVGEYRRIRRQAIGKAAPEERDRARLALARLLVSERLASEARTVLNAISDEAESDVVLQKQALRGVAAFLIGHLAEASNLLLSPDLRDDDEIEIWRAALDSVEDQWQAAVEGWRASNALLDAYPTRLKVDLGLLAVEAAIETGDEKMLRKGIRRLASLPLDPYDQARVDAMRALKAERSGDLESARALLTDLTESPHPAIRTLADFQLAALDLEVDPGESDALATLDRHMPLWRGHPHEQNMLDELARRFKDANALRKALATWRRLIRLYPEAADNDELNTVRQDTFVQALANEAEPAIDLLEVYAIYLDFINLLPSAPEARDVHRHLARHLTDLDLLDPAIDVLQSLMASSANDQERAELAIEMATLMLRQDRPTPALAVLDGIGGSGDSLPSALDERRGLARAEALAALDRADDALRALQDLQSSAARRLRAEILWNERRWPRLAAAIEAYFSDRDPATSLTEDDQELVLRLALARQRQDAVTELDALRERFGDMMRSGPYAEAFEVSLQRATEAGDIDSLLANTENQLAELERFLQATGGAP